MNIQISNCNNIESGNIEITKNKLNIKFGINGTGKSTIAKAIKYKIQSPDNLKGLIPFKYRNTDPATVPEVIISEEPSRVMIFDEEYLNQFLFKEDELISNSYEIFINTEANKSFTEKIENQLFQIKKKFLENETLNTIILDFESLSKSFSTTQTGLSKASALVKGLKNGNQIKHIPKSLIGYSEFIENKSCVDWLDWQNRGSQFLEISDNCPYCTAPAKDKKETIKSISTVYDKNVVKNFTIIIEALRNLGEYFSDDANKTLKEITEKQKGLEDAEMSYIVVVKQQIDNLLIKLKDLKSISSSSFKDDDNIENRLTELKINIDLFDRFKADKTKEVIDSLNSSLDTVLTEVGKLKGEIIRQKILVKSLIEKYKKNIDSFLTNAGYKYTVEIENDSKKNYRLILRHLDSDNTINGGKQYLSYGERNAFSLVLFMYEAISKKADLIILDDPISSFDKSKKYAIMHMLFRGNAEDCFLNKTVLMLTHDIDPIIDTIKTLQEFGTLSEAKHLSSRDGVLTEKAIKKSDILTFAQICKKALASDLNVIIKLIYLRRHFEIIDDKGYEYQVLSNLFHKRKREECKDQRKEIGDDLMNEDDFNSGVETIKKLIDDFDYSLLLSMISDRELLKAQYFSTSNSYAKLNIFRLLHGEKGTDIPSVLRKFINETFHIENELISQLDPNEYDLIPGFIIKECDKYFSE